MAYVMNTDSDDGDEMMICGSHSEILSLLKRAGHDDIADKAKELKTDESHDIDVGVLDGSTPEERTMYYVYYLRPKDDNTNILSKSHPITRATAQMMIDMGCVSASRVLFAVSPCTPLDSYDAGGNVYFSGRLGVNWMTKEEYRRRVSADDNILHDGVAMK